MLEDLPNAAFVIGYVDASWTLGADATAQMICRMLRQMSKEGVSEIVPRRTEEEKANMQEAPLLNLSSTYVSKALGSLPKAGKTGQWRARSYYYQDIMMAWYGGKSERSRSAGQASQPAFYCYSTSADKFHQ